jgi:hypothetical protein
MRFIEKGGIDMDKTDNMIVLNIILWNIGITLLSGFCCWHFKTLWGLLPLLLVKQVSHTEEKKTE